MDLSGPAAKAEQAFMLAVTPTDPCEKHKMSGRDSEIFAVPRKCKAEERTTRCKRRLTKRWESVGLLARMLGQQGQSI